MFSTYGGLSRNLNEITRQFKYVRLDDAKTNESSFSPAELFLLDRHTKHVRDFFVYHYVKLYGGTSVVFRPFCARSTYLRLSLLVSVSHLSSVLRRVKGRPRSVVLRGHTHTGTSVKLSSASAFIFIHAHICGTRECYHNN